MNILNIIKGSAGIGLIQLVDIIPSPDTIAEIIKIAGQIIILVVTLLTLLRKKKIK